MFSSFSRGNSGTLSPTSPLNIVTVGSDEMTKSPVDGGRSVMMDDNTELLSGDAGSVRNDVIELDGKPSSPVTRSRVPSLNLDGELNATSGTRRPESKQRRPKVKSPDAKIHPMNLPEPQSNGAAAPKVTGQSSLDGGGKAGGV